MDSTSRIARYDSPLGPESLLEKVRGLQQPPSAIGFDRDPSKPVVVQFGTDRTEFADPRTGESMGSGNKTVRGFFKSDPHVAPLAGPRGSVAGTRQGDHRRWQPRISRSCRSGIFLWCPKRWTRSGAKAITLLQRRLEGPCPRLEPAPHLRVLGRHPPVVHRHLWNRHVPPVGAMPWFTGSPEKRPRRGAQEKAQPFTMAEKLAGLDAALAVVKVANPDWQNIQLQFPFDRSATFAVSDSHRGRPDKRRGSPSI